MVDKWAKEWLEQQRKNGEKGLEIKKQGTNHYVYHSKVYWDKNTKKSKKTSQYVGKLDPIKGILKSRKNKDINASSLKNIQEYGISFLFAYLTEDLKEVLGRYFPKHYEEILALSFNFFNDCFSLEEMECRWQNHYISKSINPKLNAESIPGILQKIGENIAGMDLLLTEMKKDKKQYIYEIETQFHLNSTGSIKKMINSKDLQLPFLNYLIILDAESELPIAINYNPCQNEDENNIVDLFDPGTSKKLFISKGNPISPDNQKYLKEKNVNFIRKLIRTNPYYDNDFLPNDHFFHHNSLIKYGKEKHGGSFFYIFDDQDLRASEEKKVYENKNGDFINENYFENYMDRAGKYIFQSNIDVDGPHIFEQFLNDKIVQEIEEKVNRIIYANKSILNTDEKIRGLLFSAFIYLHIYYRFVNLLSKNIPEKNPNTFIARLHALKYIEFEDDEIYTEVTEEFRVFETACGKNIFSDNITKFEIEKLVIGTYDTYKYTKDAFMFPLKDQVVLNTTHESLLRFDENGDLLPYLAESWEVSSDKTTWIFYIRKNLKWHDNMPFTADDVIFTFEYHEKTLGTKYFSNLVSIEKNKENEVVLTFSSADYNILNTISRLPIIPKHIWEKIETKNNISKMFYTKDEKNQAIGVGPYSLKQIDEKKGIIIFEANKKYYLGTPKIKEIILQEYNDYDLMIQDLKNGKLDSIYNYSQGINFYYVPQLIGLSGIQIMNIDSVGPIMALWPNNMKKPFSDKQFRRAISYSINYKEINYTLNAGYGDEPDANLVPNKGFKYYKKSPTLIYDRELASQMLDEMGFEIDSESGFRNDSEGKRLVLNMLTRQSEEGTKLATLLKKYLEDIGLELKIKKMERNDLLNAIYSSKKNPECKTYDLVVVSTTFAGMISDYGYGTTYIGAHNHCGWANYDDPEYLELEKKLQTTTNERSRKKVVEMYQDHLIENLPVIPLYRKKMIQAYDNKYKGYVFDPFYGIFNPETWFNLRKSEKENAGSVKSV
ncbi:ABC transporter substrate-binding protein [uncultured Methanolobus sp.]|uniref:ABC transporter substrate-binding protein n=1 Tax=uncultured Methanolobus sp. TaxID=218300 RepID=UPI0029C7E19B|nr:ABC transporter substrate-binding protein [uncultured Methanolobus sp.]